MPADLFGKTVLIIGFGRIGTRTAKACLALGMTVRVYDPYVAASAITAAGCTPEGDLDAALPHADFVTIHCPKTPETTGMFDASRLSRMRASAYLVNTARGGIIDEGALHSALTRGVIRAAGLDVFDREPPSPDNPLLTLDSVLTAPHMAGVTKESFERMAIAVANNLLSVHRRQAQRRQCGEQGGARASVGRGQAKLSPPRTQRKTRPHLPRRARCSIPLRLMRRPNRQFPQRGHDPAIR